ncbi:MAG: dTDP-4-dehydrorhamnose reductase [Proteobacteria bacterium]|nr:dTDP-4-dehydrorhamnose reductase [Pseudomonadota bacterium]
MAHHKIMLFGAGGQIGQTIQYLASQNQAPVGWEIGFFSRKDCDITDPAALRNAILSFAPDMIINAAAITNVDEAEKNRDMAEAVNFRAVAQMAAHCSAMDIPMIHLSTDYVFDGRENTPYREDAAMNPINIYGATKMMAEESLRHELAWHVILRISSVFGPFGHNILTKALEKIEREDELRFVTDIVSAPTAALDVVRTICAVGAQVLAGKAGGYGTFHYCGTPACSRYAFINAVMERYAPYTARRPKITATVCAEFVDSAPRPAYSILDCQKIRTVYGLPQPLWQAGLDEALRLLAIPGRISHKP